MLIISWLLCGILSALIVTMYELRGKEYNTNDFDDNLPVILTMCLSGYASVLVIIPFLLAIRCEKHKTSIKDDMYKFIYKIANIGLDKNNNNMKSITNAERLSNLLSDSEDSIDSASDEIWNMTKLNDEFEDYHQLRDWLKEKCKKNK